MGTLTRALQRAGHKDAKLKPGSKKSGRIPLAHTCIAKKHRYRGVSEKRKKRLLTLSLKISKDQWRWQHPRPLDPTQAEELYKETLAVTATGFSPCKCSDCKPAGQPDNQVSSSGEEKPGPSFTDQEWTDITEIRLKQLRLDTVSFRQPPGQAVNDDSNNNVNSSNSNADSSNSNAGSSNCNAANSNITCLQLARAKASAQTAGFFHSMQQQRGSAATAVAETSRDHSVTGLERPNLVRFKIPNKRPLLSKIKRTS